MSASVLLRCDSVITGERCPAVVLLDAISAVAARDDASLKGWTTKRTVKGHSGPARDYCPDCTARLAVASPKR